MKNKIILILTLFFSFFLNYESKSQCVISTSPSCLEVGNNILISVNNAGGGVQVLYNGSPVFQSTNTPFIFTPNNPGSYFIQYSGGFFGPFCSTTIQVTDQPIELSLTNDTTLLCSGGNIDYNSLGINHNNRANHHLNNIVVDSLCIFFQYIFHLHIRIILCQLQILLDKATYV